MPLPLLLAAALLQAAPPDGPDVAELRRAYEQSCLQRDYGAFDDVCEQISDEIAAYERSRRGERRPSRGADARRGAPAMAEPSTPPVTPQAPQSQPQGAAPPPVPAKPAADVVPAGDQPSGIAADDAGATALAQALGEPSGDTA